MVQSWTGASDTGTKFGRIVVAGETAEDRGLWRVTRCDVTMKSLDRFFIVTKKMHLPIKRSDRIKE